MSKPRDILTGRYTWEDLNRPCVCGHRLGVHTAAKFKNEQPCCDCICSMYKPERKWKPGGR